MERGSTLAGGEPGNLASLGASFRTDYAHALIWLGFLLYNHDQPQIGHLNLQEATDIFRTAGDSWGLGWALDVFSQMKFRDGDAETAYAMAREGADAYRKSGDRSGVAICVHDLGDYTAMQGNFLEARGYLEEALSVFREFGLNWMASQTLIILGEVARGLDEYEKAEDCYREGLSMIPGKWRGARLVPFAEFEPGLYGFVPG